MTFHHILDHALFGPALEVDVLRGNYTTSASVTEKQVTVKISVTTDLCLLGYRTVPWASIR